MRTSVIFYEHTPTGDLFAINHGREADGSCPVIVRGQEKFDGTRPMLHTAIPTILLASLDFIPISATMAAERLGALYSYASLIWASDLPRQERFAA